MEFQGHEVFERHTLNLRHPILTGDSPFNIMNFIGIRVIKVNYNISIQRCGKTGTISLAERW